MKTLTNILKNSILLPYVYARLTAKDAHDLFNPFLTRLWNFFDKLIFVKALGTSFLLFLIFGTVRVLLYRVSVNYPFAGIAFGVACIPILIIMLIMLLNVKAKE